LGIKVLGAICGVLAIGCIILGLMVIDQDNQYETGYYQGWGDATSHSTELATDAYNEGWDDGFFIGWKNANAVHESELRHRIIK